MKRSEWYVAALFVAALWAVCVPLIHAVFAVAGIPLAAAIAVTHILGMFMTMLALLLLAMGSARVVAADIRRREADRA